MYTISADSPCRQRASFYRSGDFAVAKRMVTAKVKARTVRNGVWRDEVRPATNPAMTIAAIRGDLCG